MNNPVKKSFNGFLILAIALIIGTAACTSSKTAETSNANAAGGAAHDQTSTENKQETKKESPKSAESKLTADGLPELKKGEDYQKIVREKMLKAGWKPARSKEADWCGTQEIICDKFEEYEASTAKDLISFRWQKGSKFVEILAVGETQTPDSGYSYDSYVLEKDSQTVVQAERWEEFWNEFKTAINNKNKEKLKYLMADKIDGGGDVETADQRIAAIEESNMWESMKKTVAEGTKIDKCQKPCRSSKDGYLIFEYSGNGWWKWSGLGGEGGGI